MPEGYMAGRTIVKPNNKKQSLSPRSHLDQILKRVIEHNVPFKIRDAIKSELNSKNIELIDLEDLIPFVKNHILNLVTYSGDADSVLVGLTGLEHPG